MKKVFRQSALALSISGVFGLAVAANHPASFGVYRTAVQEDRLFIEEGTLLRCDLFFSSAQSDSEVVAHKGSRVSQSVPPFVWQYSGLLPVSDYLKTVAIHSVGSREKERSWQDVQLTFYEGLRAEGARDFEAKVAYAGAYAFAPRWPLVEFIDITDPERDKDSRLYRVEYILADPKGITIDEYRSLVMDIEANSADISLQDIRGVIDAADAARASTSEDDSWLKRVWRNETPQMSDEKLSKAAVEKAPAVSDGNPAMLFESETKTPEEMSQGEMSQGEMSKEEMSKEAMVAPAETAMPQVPATDESVEGEAVAIPDDVAPASDSMESADKMEPDMTTEDIAVVDDGVSLQEDIEAIKEEMADAPAEDKMTDVPVEESAVVFEEEIAPEANKASDMAEPVEEQSSVEEEGVLVELDEILVDEQAPAELTEESGEMFGEEGAEEKAAEQEAVEAPENKQEQSTEEEWVVMPDGTEVLKF